MLKTTENIKKKPYIERYKRHITKLCRQNEVKTLYAFGSVLTDRFNEKSDIDLIVNIDSSNPLDYADNYFNLKFAMQDLFNRPVDLLEEKAVRNQYFINAVNATKKLIYAK